LHRKLAEHFTAESTLRTQLAATEKERQAVISENHMLHEINTEIQRKLAAAEQRAERAEEALNRAAHELRNALGFIEREANYSALQVDTMGRIEGLLATLRAEKGEPRLERGALLELACVRCGSHNATVREGLLVCASCALKRSENAQPAPKDGEKKEDSNAC
jgi:hypothetical protein